MSSIKFSIIEKDGGVLWSKVFDQPTIKVGRMSTSNLKFEESDGVQRMHAVIERNEGTGAWVLLSLGVDTTMVNSNIVNKCNLRSGDLVQFGHVEVLVTIDTTPLTPENQKPETKAQPTEEIRMEDFIMEAQTLGLTMDDFLNLKMEPDRLMALLHDAAKVRHILGFPACFHFVGSEITVDGQRFHVVSAETKYPYTINAIPMNKDGVAVGTVVTIFDPKIPVERRAWTASLLGSDTEAMGVEMIQRLLPALRGIPHEIIRLYLVQN